jgi:hypothetical protein
MLFAMLKPVLSEGTVSKSQIFMGESKWKPVLLSNLPPDQLLVKYGGTLVDK